MHVFTAFICEHTWQSLTEQSGNYQSSYITGLQISSLAVLLVLPACIMAMDASLVCEC